jgi:hypothetical protein
MAQIGAQIRAVARDALYFGSARHCVRLLIHSMGTFRVCHFQSATDHLIDLYEMLSGLIPEISIYNPISTEGQNAYL